MGKTYEERLNAKPVTAPPAIRTFKTPRPQAPSKSSTDVADIPNSDRVTEVDGDDEKDIEAVPSSTAITGPDSAITWVQRALADPLVQDLNPHSRYYLDHFATQICADMVVYDGPGQNPFRDLIPATSAYPLLLQIVLANGALHVFNITREPSDVFTDHHRQKSLCLAAYYKAVSPFGGPLKSSYRDALVAKSNALALLAQSIGDVNNSNVDILLATILFFVNYALIESGQDQWKVHMEGARRLIELCGTPPFRPNEMSRLRTCLISDFLVFYILGSLFYYTTTPKLIPDTIPLENILSWAETNNYLSCPAPLLRIMLQSFELPDKRTSTIEPVTPEMHNRVKELLEAALAFDPVQWTHDYLPVSPFEEPEKRARIASAHRSAVCIYLARTLPYSNPLINPAGGEAIVNLPDLANDIIYHISHLQPGDSVFKSISWPLFLAGAELETQTQRTWVLDILDNFYSVMYWGYIPSVRKILETIWDCRDRTKGGVESCWMDEVQQLGFDLLIA
ncbi:hypothetical protein BU24DRAFT_348891 [Aaosphaeria arxii CBS 175.79]|uniref:Acriflavine sensitivity control protein acr-2 n=1 Tax=Aaosphaeria arxii CBS 175.79 TaxID=1450172 RepID=A0A6A5XQD8_9PLEO|nr:uncharacterized protein BU24DRAFT_348891 [Aaosphaeria arxii CBS 175.79]KAF2015116.1 hypothetical protein BU24DRAFT_348891 [Aaosphaeria arxii CBS 175.79]